MQWTLLLTILDASRGVMMQNIPASLIFCIALLLWLLNTSSALQAGEVSLHDSLSFGTIDLHPSGDTIVVDAKNGEATPGGSRSVVTGGGSGLITVTPSLLGDEQVEILYPASVTLDDDNHHNLTIVDIAGSSEYGTSGFDLFQGGAAVDISVGGKLALSGNEVQNSYSGSIPIDILINFF